MSAANSEGDEIYTLGVGEVAALLGVSRETVHNYAERGALPYREKQRRSKLWKYFNPTDVENFIRHRGEASA